MKTAGAVKPRLQMDGDIIVIMMRTDRIRDAAGAAECLTTVS